MASETFAACSQMQNSGLSRQNDVAANKRLTLQTFMSGLAHLYGRVMNPITVMAISGLGLGSTSIIQTQNQEDWEMGGWKASRSISRGSVTHHTVEKVE